MQRASEKQFLTPTELIEYLRISRRTYSKLKDSGQLPPFIEIGSRAVRFPMDQLKDWERKKARQTVSA